MSKKCHISEFEKKIKHRILGGTEKIVEKDLEKLEVYKNVVEQLLNFLQIFSMYGKFLIREFECLKIFPPHTHYRLVYKTPDGTTKEKA